MYALVDCNNFYASCESVFRPDLKGQPIVVLSNNDGCVIARNTEAKALGVPMGAPCFKYDRFFKQHNIRVFSSNYPLYGDMSKRVMSILANSTPDIEIYSIDEAFLYFGQSLSFQPAIDGEKLRRKVLKSTGIPVSIGFAPTKSLAKLANRVAKKFQDYTGGVYIIDSQEKIDKALKWLKIGDVWGVGRRNARKLLRAGVQNAYQFTQLSDQFVKRELSIVGLRLKYDLSGKPTLGLEALQPKKNIATTRSFDRDYNDFSHLKEHVSSFAVACAKKLRKQRSNCNAVTVFLRTNPHKIEQPQYYNSITVELPYASNSDLVIAKYALIVLRKIYYDRYHYKKAGVIISDFTPESQEQTNLFEQKDPRHKKLMSTIDKLNDKIGEDKIRLGSQYLGKEKRWKTRQERLSKKYTTNINEIIRVKV
ncbi:MAG: Y-family DNA polymerase [Salibacter sp.]|uniref:Y-family DNA polymerase n=1 Tax=Salibacter sp. TaxID=2010995 RepID=UPI002870A11D|nr:Y-family DNA polymerase [Salibacter sp.]MDR9399315.1 Y-family DNA polymerase [Salibacter sp.]